MELGEQKQYPDNYSGQVLEVFGAMTMTGMKKLQIVGSASVRSQLYAGDYDAVERVELKSVNDGVQRMRDVIKRLRALKVYIGDIKCGEVAEWNVFRPSAHIEDGEIRDFNRTESLGKLDELKKAKIISPTEHTNAARLLNDATTPFAFIEARKSIRFHILRWKPIDILNGVLDYRSHSFALEDALKSGGMVKIDVVANINDQFTEFSVIYELFVSGKRITAPVPPIVSGLTEDMIYYEMIDPFKALKRFFSLARHFKDYGKMEKIVPILNGDLGRLYQMLGDLKTLEDLLGRSSAPVAQIRAQIDEIRERYGSLYQIKSLVAAQHKVIGRVLSVVKTPTTKLHTALSKLIDELQSLLNEETLKSVAPLLDMKKLLQSRGGV
jgi:hypothetical protein